LTVAALEPKFWQRLCELIDLPELIGRQWEPRLSELEHVFASRSLAEWVELFDGEDVCGGPVATLEEAASQFSSDETLGQAPRLGEDTDAWRTELGL
jgi:crotonobetainyl-CoA:carnitine CoA-transferase CaiB-like acyl-CoA transferase